MGWLLVPELLELGLAITYYLWKNWTGSSRALSAAQLCMVAVAKLHERPELFNFVKQAHIGRWEYLELSCMSSDGDCTQWNARFI